MTFRPISIVAVALAATILVGCSGGDAGSGSGDASKQIDIHAKPTGPHPGANTGGASKAAPQ